MAKKKLRKKVQRKPAATAKKAAAPVVDSAREIWLAGLGALSVAQKESEKVLEQGTKFFDKLVSEGNKVEKSTRKDVESAVKDFRGEVESRVETVKKQAETIRKQADTVREKAETARKQAFDGWDKLENIFEDRVAKALASLGIPSREDVKGLSDRVQKLSRQVAELDKKTKARKPLAVKKAAPKKTVAKKAAPKKTVARKPAAKKAAPKKAVKKAPRAVKKVAPKPVAAKETPKAA